MKLRMQNRTKRLSQRVFPLSLACALMVSQLVSFGLASAQYTEEQLREEFGDNYAAVQALEPGESVISGDYLYTCREEKFVRWDRAVSLHDIGRNRDGDRVLITWDNGEKLLTGNDLARYEFSREVVGKDWHYAFEPARYTRTYSEYDQLQKKWVTHYYYPELVELQKQGGLPNSFVTKGGMNTPYLKYVGVDTLDDYATNFQTKKNENSFKLILSRDDDTKSGVGIGRKDERFTPKSVDKSCTWTFEFRWGEAAIFQHKDDDDELAFYHNDDYLVGKIIDVDDEEEYWWDISRFYIWVGEEYMDKVYDKAPLEVDHDAAEQDPNNLKNIFDGAIEFYHWQKVNSYKDLPVNGEFRALLIWDDKYFLEGDDWRYADDEKQEMHTYINEHVSGGAAKGNVAQHPEIDLSADEFYSVGGLNTPYLTFVRYDSLEENDHCPQYTFVLSGADDRPSGKQLFDGDNDARIGSRHLYGPHDLRSLWGIIVGRALEEDNDASPGKVKIFCKENNGYDTGLKYSGNHLYGDDDGDDWDFGEFTMYVGYPTTYPAITMNYVVGEDQYVRITQNAAMYQNVTITVMKGGILSVESWFMNNGRIVVDGGTLVIQNDGKTRAEETGSNDKTGDDTEDAVIMPFVDVHLRSGGLELKNGGELIVMDGARAAFGTVSATTGSSIVNRGMLLGEIFNLSESTLENREEGLLYAGYDFREMPNFRYSNPSKGENSNELPTMVRRISEDVNCFVLRSYSARTNLGKYTYSTINASATDGTVVKRDIGGMYKQPGTKAKTMLPS